MVKYIMAALALGLAGALWWGDHESGKAEVAAAAVKRLEGDLEAANGTIKELEKAAARRAKVDATQARQRANAAKTVRSKRAELEKHEDPRPIASPAQLERLRELADAANNAVRDASELP